MTKQHEKMQKDVLDVYYGEKPMTEEIKEHIDTCSECARYWSELDLLKKNMPKFDMDIEVDERIIGRAFSEAIMAEERSKNVRDLAVFIIIAGLILGMVGMLIYLGYGKSIIAVQIILVFFTPLLIPFMIRQRLVKEEN